MTEREEPADEREPAAEPNAAWPATPAVPGPEAASEPPADAEPQPIAAAASTDSPEADAAPAEKAPPAAPAHPPPPRGFLAEPPETAIEAPADRLRAQSRRDFLLFAAGTLAAAASAWWLLPDRTKARWLGAGGRDRLDTLAARVGLTRERREQALDRALTFDDDVAEALYSKDRRVRTYDRSEITPLRNNYHGRTPGPEFLPGWRLNLTRLAAGRDESLTLADLVARFPHHEQVTRLVCVEGWSAVAWWGGIRFADLLRAFPPAAGAKWAALRSSVSMDGAGRPEPYYVSIDLPTAMHPQVLLATHQNGVPLMLAHGAPLRLLVPMKLGLKNIKAVTDIAFVPAEPADYWNERGYSRYDGL